MCYTYDNLNRVTKRRIISLSCNCLFSEENYTYDAAGNIIDAPDSCFIYDNNSRLTTFNGNAVSYDLDGNMLSDGCATFEYDSANRLITACDHTYTYNAEDVRIRNLCSDADTTYTYNTNCKLSQLLTKTTNGITTKYVYGNGLIGEEESGEFKTYHFDYRGSTVAITDEDGSIIDNFKYDTYGNVTEHIGNSAVIFGYNGRDGVVTDENGLIYMRARYYSPAMRRFVNADILHGEISDSTSLNRYSYVNGNPVSFVDPFGFSSLENPWNNFKDWANKKIVTPFVESAKSLLKNILTDLLYIESQHATYELRFDDNNFYVNDYVNQEIEWQSNVSEYYLGDYSMGFVGCEVIAVYNAMILSDYQNVSLLNTIETFQNEGALVLQDFLRGGFGSNPYAISRVLDAYDVGYTKIDDLNALKGPGVYIVSFWNNMDFDSQIHTVTVEIDSSGKPEVKNSTWTKVQNGLFITGYKISENDVVTNIEGQRKNTTRK